MHTVTAHSRSAPAPTLLHPVRAFLLEARKLIALAGAPYLEGRLPPV